MDELAARREANRASAQDAAKQVKSKSQVKAHDRTGSKGVKAHDRKLTPAEKTQSIAKEMLKQDRDSEGKEFPKSKQGLNQYIESKRQFIEEKNQKIEELKAQHQELNESAQKRLNELDRLKKESDDRINALSSEAGSLTP